MKRLSSALLVGVMFLLQQPTFALTIASSGTEGVDQNYDPVSNTTTFTANTTNAIIHPTTIVNKLLSGHVILIDTIDPNVNLSNNTILTWNTPNNLIVNAKQHITVGNQSQFVSQSTGNLVLRANYNGVTEGTLVPPVAAAPIVLMNGGGSVKIYYRPRGFDLPTDFSANVKVTAPGTATAYMLVNTPQDLLRMNWNVYGNYALAKDIDANDLQGFLPIGSVSYPYMGKFDGQGFTINNIKLNLPNADYVGFFGRAMQATIENIHLINMVVQGGGYVGGLVGESYATNIFNAHVDGNIQGTGWVGGLVGVGTYNAPISQCFTEGSVRSVSGYTGGLIGGAGSPGITDSFSVASVSSNSPSGGLIGRMQAGGGNFRNLFVAGSVSGPGLKGGVLGDINSAFGSMRSVFWDRQTTGQTNPGGSIPLIPGTIGYDTAQMYRKSTYLDWNFDSVWGINEGQGYPYLLWTKKSAPWTYMFNAQKGVRKIVG